MCTTHRKFSSVRPRASFVPRPVPVAPGKENKSAENLVVENLSLKNVIEILHTYRVMKKVRHMYSQKETFI